jgi:hypothetical protein
MFSKIAIGVAAVGLTLAAAALQPASANYAPCVENPAGPLVALVRSRQSNPQ